MKILQKIQQKLRRFSASRGFSCDGCGAELFDYPVHRLCARCEEKMRYNNGKTCEKCGRKTVADGVCLNCKSRLPRFDKGFSPFVYRGESAALINRLKNGRQTLAPYFAEHMAETLLGACEDMERFFGEEGGALYVIPVPTTAERERERGFNQAEVLADALTVCLQAKGVRAELRTDIMEKHRETAQQKHKGYRERMENVAGAYRVTRRKECKGITALLVDDIMTTGATGSECASRLLSAGAERVFFLTATSLPELK